MSLRESMSAPKEDVTSKATKSQSPSCAFILKKLERRSMRKTKVKKEKKKEKGEKTKNN